LWEAGDRTWEVISGPGSNLDIMNLDIFQAFMCRANLPGDAIPQTVHARDTDVYTGCEFCRQEGYPAGNQPQDPNAPPDPPPALRRLRRLRICGLCLCVEHYNRVMSLGHYGVRTCPYCTILIDHVHGPYTEIN